MSPKVISRAKRYGQLLFMVVVTAWILAAVYAQASKGLAGAFGAVVFAFAAGFGLEFVCAVWTGRRSATAPSSSVGH